MTPASVHFELMCEKKHTTIIVKSHRKTDVSRSLMISLLPLPSELKMLAAPGYLNIIMSAISGEHTFINNQFYCHFQVRKHRHQCYPPLLNETCTSLLRAPVSKMTYTVSSGTLNTTVRTIHRLTACSFVGTEHLQFLMLAKNIHLWTKSAIINPSQRDKDNIMRKYLYWCLCRSWMPRQDTDKHLTLLNV